MPTSRAATLVRATADMAPLLANLLELYIHDMSEVFPVGLKPDGRFGYEKLPLYWSEPASRFAFLIKSGTGIAGFALVTRGSPMTEDPTDLDVAEFFVLRGYRRSGVGRQAAFALWDDLGGRWVVRVSEANRSGLRFWSEVIGDYTGRDYAEEKRPGGQHGWRVFTFTAKAKTAS